MTELDEPPRFAYAITRRGLRRRRRARANALEEARTEVQLAAVEKMKANLLASTDPTDFEALSKAAGLVTTQGSDAGLADEISPHERYLDKWRVGITAGLIGALSTVVVLVLLIKSVGTSATPYVSLLSGLAGIALGWMFAGGGNATGTARRQRPPAAAATPPRRAPSAPPS